MSGDVNKSSNGADCFVMIANTVLINGTSNIYQQSPYAAGCKLAGLNVPLVTIPEQKSVAVLKKRGATDDTFELKMIIAWLSEKATEKACALNPDERGASALEFAIFAGILAFGLLNTADVSIYIYKRMQVENATEMAAQAAWKA